MRKILRNSKLLKSILIPTLGIFAIGSIAAVSTSCGEKKPAVVPVTSVELNKASTTLAVGETETLTATVLPENATDKSVTWTSSDTNVATVENGVITAVGLGNATITVTTKDGGKTDTCEVNVNTIHVTSVTLNKASTTLAVGDTEQLTVTVLPEEATDKSVTWTSSDENVATVENGVITAVSEGTATITVKTNDGGKTATCEVTVTNPYYVVITANNASTLELKNNGGNNPDLQYSTDGINWITYSKRIVIDSHRSIYLKGNNPSGWSSSYDNYSTLSITIGDVSISGNVMGLLDNGAKPEEQGDITDIPCDNCFYNLFQNSTGITSVSENFLSATTLTVNCYGFMFQGCSSLTTVSELPATSLADGCYQGMFKDCTSLKTAPELPATNLAQKCYGDMFYHCSDLTTAPDLPAKVLFAYCYSSMFQNCSSLTTVPELPATKLASYCYQDMFGFCTSLTTAPELPATTLADRCYYGMFSHCSSLTVAHNLPATTLAGGCYYGMFSSCSSLNSIKIGYTGNYSTNYFYDWVSGVASSGTFYYNGSDTLENFGFPEGWTKTPF